jgi:hypothetical protein
MTRAPEQAATAARRLSELRRAGAADATLQNLLAAMGAKLDLCSRLPVFEYEAASEGHETPATLFRELAEAERSTFNELVACLRVYLDDNVMPAAGRSSAASREVDR